MIERQDVDIHVVSERSLYPFREEQAHLCMRARFSQSTMAPRFSSSRRRGMRTLCVRIKLLVAGWGDFDWYVDSCLMERLDG